MKLSALFAMFALVLCFLGVQGQSADKIIHLPAHKIYPKAGKEAKVLWTRITNQSDFADTLYPLYNGAPGSENKYRNEQSLINWVVKQVPVSVLKGGDTTAVKLALIYSSAPLTKGDTKLSSVNFFNENKCDNPDSAFARKYSIIGSQLAVYHDHCGDQVRFQQRILLATGYFKPSDFLLCILGWHTTCGIIINGDTLAVDFANNKPFLLIKNAKRKSGFASPQDLYSDTLLINNNQVYRYVNEKGDTQNRNLKPGFVSEYRQTYAAKKPQLKKADKIDQPAYKIENMWVMPPHSVVEWADTFYYVIDSTGSKTINKIMDRTLRKEIAFAETKIKTSQTNFADSINWVAAQAIAEITGTDIATARDIFFNDKLTLYSSTPGWRPVKAMAVPHFQVTITADSNFIIFGKDAYFGAGLVTMQHLKNQFTDTRLYYNLWANSIMSMSVVPQYKKIIYPINNEIFVPPASTLQLEVSYNPAIIDFYKGVSFSVSNPKALRIEVSDDAIVNVTGGQKK